MAHSRQSQESLSDISQGSRINAKEINLIARGDGSLNEKGERQLGNINLTHTDLTSRDEEGKRIKDSKITLTGNELNIKAGESHTQFKGRNQSVGVEVGMAATVGAQTGVGVYARVGGSAGKEDGESKTYQASHLDAQTVTLNSQGDTNLLGSQIKGNTVNANVGGKLNIESLQDEERFKTKSSGGGLEGEFGFGNNWSLSGYGNASKGTTHRKQVNEQAGIFAEDGGYHINADSVHLKGGAIASTNPTNSKLATNKLTFEDIQNESSSSAASASISGSLKESKEKWVDNETGSAVKPNTENSTKLDSQRSGGISPGLPMFERDSDSSVTRATLTEGTIILNKDTHPTVTTAKELGINTDLAQANNQVAQTKDVKAQLQGQQQIATAIGNVKSAVDTYTSNKQEEAEQEVRRLKSRLEKAKQQGNQETVNQLKKDLMQAEVQAENWGTGGSTKRAVDAITHAGLIALSGGSSQSIATAAASPYVNQLIKKATEDYPALNIPTHILWGAVEAELMGGKASTGAISTAAGELGAKYLTEHLYNKEAKDLTETERNQVKEMAKALAGVAGGLAAAGQGASAVKILSESSIGTTVTHNAVENNYLSVSESKRKADLEAKKAKGTITSDEDQELTLLDKTDIDRDVALVSACRSNPLSSECNVERKKLESIKVGYTASENRSSWYGYPVYERYSDIYPEQSEKINKFSYDYDVLRITKENANKAFAERFGLSKETVDRIDIGVNLLSNLLAGYSAGKINPKDLHTAQKGVTFAKGEKTAVAVVKGSASSTASDIASNTLETVKNSRVKALTCSFRGDMEVKTEQGYKPIESIKIGDKVYAKNELTGQMTYQRVQAHYNNPYDFTVYVEVIDEQGKHQTLVSNKIHPFFTQVNQGELVPSSEGHHYNGEIQNAQWVDAQNLKAGYKLLSENNHWQTVKGVSIKAEKLNAYNLTVETDHTYFIKGANSDLDGVWVHNDCWNSLPADAVNTGKTTPDGRALYTFKDNTGKQVTAYKGKDGRYYDPKVYSPTKSVPEGVKSFNPHPNRNGLLSAKGHVYYTTPEATEAAKKLGFEKTNFNLKGEAIYKDSKGRYITVDVGNGRSKGGSHNGGVWKMADSVKNLGKKETRMGTYDADLNRIGD